MRTSPTGSAGSGTRPASELITSTPGCSRAASARASAVPPSRSTRINARVLRSSRPRPASRSRIQIAVREALGGKHVSHDDDRRLGDVCGVHLLGEVGERAAQHDLLRPARERHHRTGCFGPVATGQQLRDDRVDLRGGQMQHQRRTRRRQRLEVLPLRHRRRQRRDPSQRHGLRDTRNGQLTARARPRPPRKPVRPARFRNRRRAHRVGGTARRARCTATGRPSAVARRRARPHARRRFPR